MSNSRMSSYSTNETNVDDGNLRRHVANHIHHDKKRSSTSMDTPSPPSYAVHEDEYGNLINRALNVTWPARPRQGRYSLSEYRDRKKRLLEHQQRHQKHKQQIDESSESSKTEQRLKDNVQMLKRTTEGENSVFVGVRAASTLRSMLRPTEFRLFYMRPESMSSFNQVPIKLPLMLAYMSASGTMYNFGFKEHELESGTFWQLDMNGLDGAEQPIFRSMKSLINHYKSFVINRGDGKADIFPVDE